MKTKLTLYAPAKLNLHLDVQDRRDDGFHELRSIFAMITLYDRLDIELSEGNECSIQGFEKIEPEKNLIWQAHRLYTRETGVSFGCRVKCTKAIPERAGLGGGSSDCAAMLRALEILRCYGKEQHADRELLRTLAARLGSDVHFFLNGPAAYAEGRGELLQEIRPVREFPLILVKPEFDISTADAFRWLDQTGSRKKERLTKGEILEAYAEQNPERWPFYNSFTPVLIERYPQLKELLETLKSAGAAYCNVSGSGSSLYGLFSTEDFAKKTLITLKQRGLKVWKLKMLASLPEAVYNENRLE
ncbi:MAG: 4-(cytidine 5'-diphospho)-2-C-methyl-D-erythritol kinase [Spirochaetota bacterium]|nr:4-(cytidine 5'-diphospho)-2-C-methyl-D-erythritol kinase [Spirochaetota bacterium]